jgi:MFS family permease
MGRRFHTFLVGLTLSKLGDMVFGIALPWLVLQLSGSNIALSTVMTVFALPRAALLLIGGAISDRVSARNILIIANVMQALCVATIAALFGAHHLRVELLYLPVFCFGVADAFVGPATNVLLPTLVARDQVPQAIGLVQSAAQICLLIGGAVAGSLIQYFGLNMAFIADALSFLAIIFALVTLAPSIKSQPPTTGMRHAIKEGLLYVWDDPALRGLLIICICVNFCIAGVAEIGLVVLAKTHFHAAAAFGFLVTSVGIGSLIGLAVSAKALAGLSVGATLRWACAALGLLIATLAIDMPIAMVCAVTLLMGVAAGSVSYKAVAWLQMNVKAELLGRVMSLFAFGSTGLMPVSLMIAGFLVSWNLQMLMLSSAVLLALTALLVRVGGSPSIEAAAA